MHYRSLVPNALSAIVIAFMLVLSAVGLHAQSVRGLSTFGTDFFVPFIHTPDTCSELEWYRRTSLTATTLERASVDVYYFDAQGNEYLDTSVTIQPFKYAQINLKLKLLPKSKRGDSAEYTAIHVRSSAPLVLQYVATGPYNGALSTILPTELLDRHYVAASLPVFIDWGNYWASCIRSGTASSTFTIVAVEDNTHVTIGPNDPTLFGKLGYRYGQNPYTVTLSRGQVYTVKSDTTDDTFDESGSRISSDRPIAVWSGHEGSFLDYRNILAQQLLPASRWDSVGYFGIQTFSPWATYKVFTNDYGNAVRIETSDKAHTDSTLDPYQSLSATSSACTNIYSRSAKPIQVVEYGGETMTRLVPWSQGATTQIFGIPREATPDLFLYLVIRSDRLHQIISSWDGLRPRPLDSLIDPSVFQTIPNRPELKVFRIGMHTGMFALHDDSSFVAYLSSNQHSATNPVDLGSPCVQTFARHAGTPPVVRVTDEGCGHWSIHATAGNAPLVRATLLHDSLGWFFKDARGSSYFSTNVSLDTAFPVSVGDTARSFGLHVLNALQSAVAYLDVLDMNGNDTVVQLRYDGPPIHASLSELSFPRQGFGTDSCLEFSVRNDGPSHETVIIAPKAPGDSAFTLRASQPLPIELHAGDSINFTVCYHSGSDTTVHRDTVRFATACSTVELPLFAQSKQLLLDAQDLSFGDVAIGSSKLSGVLIRNVDSDTIHVFGVERIVGDTTFSFVDTALVPVAIARNQRKLLTIKYQPTAVRRDSAFIFWRTDANSGKVYSVIVGNGTELGVKLQTNSPIGIRLDRGYHLDVDCQGQAILSIYNILGRQILGPLSITDDTKLSLSQLPSGTYIVRVIKQGVISSKAIQIAR